MELIIFTGNTGCGKSTKAAELAKDNYVIINMDYIITMIGGGDYKLYDSKKQQVYHTIERSAVAGALYYGFSVVIDRTNMPKKTRGRYIEIGKAYEAEIISYNWGSGTKEDLKRRNKETRGYPEKGYWDKVFKKFKDEYEEPSLEEGFSKIIKMK